MQALVTILLLAILAGAVFVGHYGWVSAGDVVMPAWGWLMLGLGVFFTLLVGGGLMALVFYSSREGFDDPPELAQTITVGRPSGRRWYRGAKNRASHSDQPRISAGQQMCQNVRFGSEAEIDSVLANVRFVP